MNTCKSCKFWVVPTVLLSKGYAQEAGPDQPEIRACRCPKFAKQQQPTERKPAALVDPTAGGAMFITAENFGCVLHEVQDDKT